MDTTTDLVQAFRDDVDAGYIGRIGEIAEATGISLKNLRNLYYGFTDTMLYENMRALESYYSKRRKA